MINFTNIRNHLPEYHENKSLWAYMHCKYVKDAPEVYKFITNSVWAYDYCKHIKDRPEVRKHITDSKWAYCYCVFIKDRPDVRKFIKDKELHRYHIWNYNR